MATRKPALSTQLKNALKKIEELESSLSHEKRMREFDIQNKNAAREELEQVELTFVRVHPDAQLPTYATDGSACFDLHAVDIGGFTVAEHEVLQRADKYCDELVIGPGESATIRTGLKVEVPPGWRMDIYSRSGHGINRGVRLGNCVGKIDSDYRGEILVNLRNDGTQPFRVWPGDRIAQAELNPVYRVSFKEVGELSETDRGEGGFGSTGR